MQGALNKYAEVPPFAQFGYEPQTTLWGDFGVADVIGGIPAIKDTYKRCEEQFKDDKIYGTEMAMVLNHKAWEWDAKGDDGKTKLYTELYYKLHDYILDNWKGEDLQYYLRVTD